MNTNSGMNFGQQDYSGSNGAVDGMNYQFQNMGINQTPQPAQNQSSHALLGNRVPLTRTTSLVDAIGQQRSSSPFANASGGPAPQQDMFSQPGVGNNGSGPTKSALFNSWNAAHQGNLSSANSTPSLHAMAALNQPQQGAQQSAFPFQNGGANQPAGAPATAPMGHFNGHQQDDMARGGHLPQHMGMPPGMSHFMPPQQHVAPPIMISSQWKYKDVNGNIQGPFETALMTQWNGMQYFQPDLQVCRMPTSFEPFGISDRFISLAELGNLVHGKGDPFTSFDQMATVLMNPQIQNNVGAMQMHQQPMGQNGVTGGAPSFGRDMSNVSEPASRVSNFFPVQPTAPDVTRSESATPVTPRPLANNASSTTTTTTRTAVAPVVHQEPVDPSAPKRPLQDIINEQRRDLVPVANVESNDYTTDEIFRLKFADGSFYHEVSVPVPVNRSHVRRIDADTVIEKKDLGNYWEIKETLEYDEKMAQFAIEDEIKRKEDEKIAEQQRKDQAILLEQQSKKEQKELAQKKKNEKAEEMAKKLLEEQERADREMKKREEHKTQKKQKKLREQHEKALLKEKKKEEHQQKKLNQKQKMEARQATEAALRAEMEDAVDVQPEVNTAAVAEPPKNVEAPWAKATTGNSNIPTINLKEKIASADKRKQQQNAMELQRARDISNKILQEDREQESRKAVLNWATNQSPQTSVPPVDLKSQVLKKSSSKTATKKEIPQAAVDNSFGDANFIEEQKKLWEQVQRNNKKQTSTPSNDNSSWATVTKKPSSAAKAASAGTKAIPPVRPVNKVIMNPALKKSTTAASTSTTSANITNYSGNASISARQTFLKWCKSQMKLNPGISVNSVLETILQFPAGPSSNELIADIIYSSSSIMDGRRFATEFCNKRVECERQLQDPLSWGEALALPEGQDDDWEFQVVSKKKGRKH